MNTTDQLPQVQIYDTTLRDGAQQQGINLSTDDKLVVAGHLDNLGVGFIEGGWPGANAADTEFFARARHELSLANATLTAFGSTRKAGGCASTDSTLRALVDSGAPVVTLVAKAHPRHVDRALRTSLVENLAMIEDSVRFLSAQGRRVIVDAEHFFDGYYTNPEYSLEVLTRATSAGAECVVLCDTNGGMLPHQVSEVTRLVMKHSQVRVGIHAHNDTGCAVANSIEAVRAGATHVQGTINGYGERTGNANLITLIGNLQLKMGRQVITAQQLSQASVLSQKISAITGVAPRNGLPYVGQTAFTHKAGLHASALKVDPDLYQHVEPACVGNVMRTLVSNMAGRASVELKARELGVPLDGQTEVQGRIIDRVKTLEAGGHTFDCADASLELLMRQELAGRPQRNVQVIARQMSPSTPGGSRTRAEVHLLMNGSELRGDATADAPHQALLDAVRAALRGHTSGLRELLIVENRQRVSAVNGLPVGSTVVIETRWGESSWRTVGAADTATEALWEAVLDAIDYALLKLPTGMSPSKELVAAR